MSLLGFDAIGRMALGQISNPTPASGTTPTGPFSSFAPPLRKAGLAVAAIATTAVGFVAPPPAQAAAVFTQFSQPARKAVQQASWRFDLAPIQTQTAVFTRFSQPQIPRINLPDEQPSALFEVAPPPVISIAFAQFSQPLPARIVIPDEQPSALFEVLPPPIPPFTGFARFSEYLPKKSVVFLYSQFQPEELFVPVPDTHDLVFMGDHFRKKKRRDLIDEEISRKDRLRRDLEQAVYGPEVVYSPAAAKEPDAKAAPPNVEELAKTIMAAREAQAKAHRASIDEDDENVIEMILRDL